MDTEMHSDTTTEITSCRVCDGRDLQLAIGLGHQPWCGNFLKKENVGKELFYPLRVVYCHDCCTPQLDYTVPKEVMFSDHTYLSGLTKLMTDHFHSVASEVDSRFGSGFADKSVLDIGSNDGAQLKCYQEFGYEVLGVESSRTTAQIANDDGVPTLHAFFNQNLVRRLGREFSVINAAGVFFHLEELHSATEGIREALRDAGVFVAQFLYLKRIVENLAFDQIYHEHLLYYNLLTIEVLLNRHGLTMFDAYLAPIHGGSIIGFICHRGKRQPTARLQAMRQAERDEKSNELSTFVRFAERIQERKEENLRFLESRKRDGKRIYGFGAPAKGNTLLNYFGVGTQYIDCLVEINELRKGLYSPGMHIPIVSEHELERTPDVYYVLAWNFKKEILRKNRPLLDRGIEFYFPVNPKDD